MQAAARGGRVRADLVLRHFAELVPVTMVLGEGKRGPTVGRPAVAARRSIALGWAQVGFVASPPSEIRTPGVIPQMSQPGRHRRAERTPDQLVGLDACAGYVMLVIDPRTDHAAAVGPYTGPDAIEALDRLRRELAAGPRPEVRMHVVRVCITSPEHCRHARAVGRASAEIASQRRATTAP